MDVVARYNDSQPFWSPTLYDAPESWPWDLARRPIVVVQGLLATPVQTGLLVENAAAKNVTVRVGPHRCRASG